VDSNGGLDAGGKLAQDLVSGGMPKRSLIFLKWSMSR
jgi:hypothetical protein